MLSNQPTLTCLSLLFDYTTYELDQRVLLLLWHVAWKHGSRLYHILLLSLLTLGRKFSPSSIFNSDLGAACSRLPAPRLFTCETFLPVPSISDHWWKLGASAASRFILFLNLLQLSYKMITSNKSTVWLLNFFVKIALQWKLFLLPWHLQLSSHLSTMAQLGWSQLYSAFCISIRKISLTGGCLKTTDCIWRIFAHMRNGHGSQGITRYRPIWDSQATFTQSILILDLEHFGHQGLQEKIKLVPMDTSDKPAWYKTVYLGNTVWLKLKHMNFPVTFEIFGTLWLVVSVDSCHP